MSRQEILSWTSLATSASVLFFYILFFFGWPGLLPDYSEQLSDIFFNAFWIAIAVEIIIDISESKDSVNRDERDFRIEARGLKYAYGFLSIAIVVILVQIFLSGILSEAGTAYTVLGNTASVFHALFIVLLTSNIIKRSIQIYYYHTS